MGVVIVILADADFRQSVSSVESLADFLEEATDTNIHKYRPTKKMKVGSAFVGYYILALLLLNLVNVSKCSEESNEEDAEDDDVTHEEESEEDEAIDDEEEDDT